jgi:SAM-dependent methyltransferase
VFKNAFYFTTGLVFLTLAMVKHRTAGYRTPKPDSMAGQDASIAYDMSVVRFWLDYLAKFTDGQFDVAGKDFIELGPGADLGTGFYLVARGARSYVAVDAIDNASKAPAVLYERMAEVLAGDGLEVDPAVASDPDRIALIHSPDFNIAQVVGDRRFDAVVSFAAFEHFDDIDAVMRDTAAILRPGGVLVTGIDLTTHSRWIRQRDPNNIYRYPDWLYRLFRFKGIPSRLRPYEYRAAAERHGLLDVQVLPKTEDERQTLSGLSRRFRTGQFEPHLLGVMLMARKAA